MNTYKLILINKKHSNFLKCRNTCWTSTFIK